MKRTVFCLAGALCAASFANCQVATAPRVAVNTLTCSLSHDVTPNINVLAYDIGTPLAALVRPVYAGGSSTAPTSASGFATFDIRFSQMPNSFAAGTTFDSCTLVNPWLEFSLNTATVPKFDFLDNTPSGQTDAGPVVRLTVQFVTVEMWSKDGSNPPFFEDIQSFAGSSGGTPLPILPRGGTGTPATPTTPTGAATIAPTPAAPQSQTAAQQPGPPQPQTASQQPAPQSATTAPSGAAAPATPTGVTNTATTPGQ